MYYVLFFVTFLFYGLFLKEVLRLVLAGTAAKKAADTQQEQADHRRYLTFRQARAADRHRIHEQVAAESRALAEQWAEQERARTARRRLVPDWDLVNLLRQQGRISAEEYRAFCLDNTGEYCPSVVRD